MDTVLLPAAAAATTTFNDSSIYGSWEHALLSTKRTTGCRSYFYVATGKTSCALKWADNSQLWKNHSVLPCHCLLIGYDASRLGEIMNMFIFRPG